MLLSVIIPARNEARCMPGLLDMLSAQDAQDCEFVFVDDGSTDDTPRIISEAIGAGRVPGRLVERSWGGVSAARNAGIAAAQGDYVTFADADDCLAENYLERLRLQAASGVDIAMFFHTRSVDGGAFFQPARPAAKTTSEALLQELLKNPTRFGVYDFLVRRAFLLDNAISFPVGYPYYEDYAFILRLLSAAGSVADTGECVYCYRATAGSAMSTFSGERLRCLELFSPESRLYTEYPRSSHDGFRRWFASRLYWSVLWQACQCMGAREVRAFAQQSGARGHMRRLLSFPDGRVSVSAASYLACPSLYIFAVKRLGKGRTLLAKGKDQTHAPEHRGTQL